MDNRPVINVRTHIKCCNGCVPPKRQVGCHVWCEAYLAEKAMNDADKNRIYNGRVKESALRQQKIDACERYKKRYGK